MSSMPSVSLMFPAISVSSTRPPHRAIDNDADTFCHWFQLMASSGFRHK